MSEQDGEIIHSSKQVIKTKNMKPKFILILSLVVFLSFGCNNNNSEKENSASENKTVEIKPSNDFFYIKKGKQFVSEAKKILGKNLGNAIKSGGAANAVSFCSEKALFLTDSTAKSHKVKIKRVSDKNRNILNEATGKELAYINKSKKLISEGSEPKPQVFASDNKVVIYYPIIVNQMCLKCHGNISKDIETKTYETIKKLYPEDKATGYNVGDLRGIWVVTM